MIRAGNKHRRESCAVIGNPVKIDFEKDINQSYMDNAAISCIPRSSVVEPPLSRRVYNPQREANNAPVTLQPPTGPRTT